MEKQWMPQVAGILDIVSGAAGLAIGLFIAVGRHAARAAAAGAAAPPRMPGFGMFPLMPGIFGPGLGIALIVISVLAIVGGVFALRSRVWGLALAGSIAAVISGRLLGIVALVFAVLGRRDFR